MKRVSAILMILVAGLACNFGVNKTIYVEDGETKNGSLNSVNGGIIIGEDATVRGSCRTVNGRIEVGSESKVKDLQSVNGSIDVDRNVMVDGDIESVNGSVRCDSGTEIDGTLQTVNGSAKIYGTTVDRHVKTYNGSIILADNSRVKGDVIIEKTKGSFDNQKTLTVRISEQSVVEGDLIVEDDRRKVEVYLSGGGKVLGKIENAEVIEEH